MTVPAVRGRMLGAAALTAAALAALASALYAQTAGASPAPAAGVAVTASPAPSEPAPSEPAPSPTPTASPAPDPSEPAESCTFEPSPQPGVLAGARAGIDAGPVTCSNRHSIITVSWDGTNLKVVIKPNPDFGGGRLTCTLDPKSVKVTQPNNGTVDKDGVVTIPYDMDKKVKITIKIEYDINCAGNGFTVTLRDVVTIEFTPPDGPIVVTNRTR